MRIFKKCLKDIKKKSSLISLRAALLWLSVFSSVITTSVLLSSIIRNKSSSGLNISIESWLIDDTEYTGDAN